MNNLSYYSFIAENVEFTIYKEQDKYVLDKVVTPPHIHPLNELCIMIDGSAEISGDFGNVTIDSSEVCIIPPLTYHSTQCNSGNIKRIFIKFSFREIKNADYTVDLFSMLKRLLCVDSKPEKLRLGKLIIDNLIDATSDTISADSMFSTPIQIIKLKNIFSIIFIFIAEKLSNQPEIQNKNYKFYTKTPQYYEKIVHLDIMIYKFACAITSLRDIADELHICVKHLTNMVKSEFLRTPKLLAFEYRIKKAAMLLKNTPQLTIADISEKVGYGSPEILSIMFKKYYGISASEYRSIHLK